MPAAWSLERNSVLHLLCVSREEPDESLSDSAIFKGFTDSSQTKTKSFNKLKIVFIFIKILNALIRG